MSNQSGCDITSLPKSWLWSDCKLVLRRTNPNNPAQESYQNLEAEVQLQSEDIQEPFNPDLTFKKDFNFDPVKGFSWKKGNPLPPLIIKLQQNYFQLLKQDNQIIVIYCQLIVAYPSRKDNHFYLEQIRTAGQTKKKFDTSGQVQFQGIFLKQNSQQKKNSKFSLLITICASSVDQNRIILKTFISTAFYAEKLRMKRKAQLKNKYAMKLVSPHSFLRPICEFNYLQRGFSKEKLILYLKVCNQNSQKLSLIHPLYMVYHFSDIFKLYFNSRQVKDLNQLLEVVSPKNQSDSKYFAAKNALICYELKKTKRILKQSDKVLKIAKFKRKTFINARIKQGQVFQKKLLMITFQNDILEIIQNAIQNESKQNQTNEFQKQLQQQLKKLSQSLQKWTNIYLKLNFLRELPWCICWRSIQRQKMFEAYKNHYNSVKQRLSKRQLKPQKNRPKSLVDQ